MITSTSNPLVKRVRRLRQRRQRQREGVYFIEGVRVVLSALEQAAPVERLVVAEGLLTSPVAQAAVTAFHARGGTVSAVAPSVFAALSERDNPTGLGAIVRDHVRSLTALAADDDTLLVALCAIADPGNLGTILRTADATAVSGVILVGQGTDPGQGAVARASMGALYTTPLYAADSVAAVLAWARDHQVPIVATSARATTPFWDAAAFRRPALLLMGSERAGLDAATLAAADHVLTIPLSGSVTSLNLAVATGLFLYEFARVQAQQSDGRGSEKPPGPS